jgi:beta-glucosidase
VSQPTGRTGGTLVGPAVEDQAGADVVTAKPVQAGDTAQGVMFAENTTVDPQLTVSMEDESIYGYLTKGASVALPKGLTATFRSNRPQMVRVDGNQTIHTVGTGVAAVTATVHYNGGTASATFVGRVGDLVALPGQFTLNAAVPPGSAGLLPTNRVIEVAVDGRPGAARRG